MFKHPETYFNKLYKIKDSNNKNTSREIQRIYYVLTGYTWAPEIWLHPNIGLYLSSLWIIIPVYL
jgi:hypothetical protein